MCGICDLLNLKKYSAVTCFCYMVIYEMQTTHLKHLYQCTDTSGYEYTQAAPTGLVLVYKIMTSAATALKWEPVTEAGEKQS